MDTMLLIGNQPKYGSEFVEYLDDNPLKEKNILFLGSSVTYGASSMEDSIPEYFHKRFGCSYTKEAVSGTTLVDEDETSYVSRLINNVDTMAKYDYFICQLSTNDASQNKDLGKISDSFSIDSFDRTTITGAIEYIIAYVKDTWGCPVAFYTGSRYESATYGAMVERLFEIADKWNINVIDLWTGNQFNSIEDKDRNLYMNDPIHPTKAGYMKWWCPEIERQFLGFI